MKTITKPYKHEFELVFEVETDSVTEREIFGALYGETDIIEPYNLSSLQKDGKAGKCILEGRNGGKYLLRIPMTASLSGNMGIWRWGARLGFQLLNRLGWDSL